MMWYPIHSINLNLLQVKGRSDLSLKLEIWKKCIGVAILCITVPMGLLAMCVGNVVLSLISLVINAYYTEKLIDVGFFRQMRDLLPALAYSLSMGGIVWLAVRFLPNHWSQLIFGVVIGIVYFLTITVAIRSADLRELKSFIRSK